jgi:CheY-like chemotaxis protein/HPt (histidine-containing phosphotransfer) domain-containing protein
MLTPADRLWDMCDREHLRIAACLTKPVKQSELFNAILATMDIQPAKKATPSPTARMEPRLRPLRILLAEDSLVNQRLAIEMLTQRGHQVVVATNGMEVLKRLDDDRFDLILMDVQMPSMDGFEATQEIRKREKQSAGHVPIIAMTAHALTEDRQRCLDAGMDDYVAKPARASVLVATIEAVLTRLEGTGNGKTPSPDSDSKSDGNYRPAVPMAAAPFAIDWNAALESVEGNHDLLRIASEAFLRECPKLLADLEGAIQRRDIRSAKIAAHTLKGSVRYFGPSPAFDLAASLEERAVRGTLDDSETIFEATRKHLDPMVVDIEGYLRRS